MQPPATRCVGDGLVTQVPALIVSIAGGLLVSKAGLGEAADKVLLRQLSGDPKAVGMSSAVMIVMSLLPGIPMLPFLLLGGGASVLAYMMEKRSAAAVLETKKAEAETKAAPTEEPISASLKIDDLKIELSSSASVPRPADCRNRKSIRARGSRR